MYSIKRKYFVNSLGYAFLIIDPDIKNGENWQKKLDESALDKN